MFLDYGGGAVDPYVLAEGRQWPNGGHRRSRPNFLAHVARVLSISVIVAR